MQDEVVATKREFEVALSTVELLTISDQQKGADLAEANGIIGELEGLLGDREAKILKLEETMSAKVKAAETRLMPALNAALARIKELEAQQNTQARATPCTSSYQLLTVDSNGNSVFFLADDATSATSPSFYSLPRPCPAVGWTLTSTFRP